jgi:hypothetical protein
MRPCGAEQGKFRFAADQKKAGQFARPGASGTDAAAPEPGGMEERYAQTGSTRFRGRGHPITYVFWALPW